MVRNLLSLVTSFTTLCLLPALHAQDIPTEDIGDTGSLSFTLQGSPLTYTLVRAADGNVWLQQNMGASQVATSATDATAYGDLYQWGRWADGHQLRTSATAAANGLAQNNPIGLGSGSSFFYVGNDPADWWHGGSDADSWSGTIPSLTNGIDVCTELGEGWQLPTRADWINIISVEGIADSATAFASNLKLTAAGSRDGGSGTLINVGAFGNYWSSTPNTVYAKDVTIGDTFVNADDDAYRAYGMCVRCLHKSLHVGVDELNAAPDMRVFPNPSTGLFTLAGEKQINLVEVYSADMRSVLVVSPRANMAALDLTSAPSGLYLARLVSGDRTYWRTLTIQR